MGNITVSIFITFVSVLNQDISYTTSSSISLLAKMAIFKYLIRFKDASGKILFGEAGGPSKAEALLGKVVPVYQGTSAWDPELKATGETAEVKELLCPMEDSSVIHCVGLNYKAHLAESGVSKPPLLHP